MNRPTHEEFSEKLETLHDLSEMFRHSIDHINHQELYINYLIKVIQEKYDL